MQLILPAASSRGNAGGVEHVEAPGSVLIVGANGAGKTRLGVWIDLDGPQSEQVHRVGAQKSLMIPDEVTARSMQGAELALFYGIPNASQHVFDSLRNRPATGLSFKRTNRWGGKPNVAFLDDFAHLLALLFSENNDASVRYREAAKHPSGRVDPEPTRLDRVKRLWEWALPHRELVIRSGMIEVKPRGAGALYKAGEMSDGERVAFYLIGQCLSVPSNSVVVVDEPEIHLHRAVQDRLWDEIEHERSDCLFVYLTHDLDFAASRLGAAKIWLKAYESDRWDWEPVPEAEGLPEEVLLAVIGSRKPVLFVEGDRGGLEHLIFARIYPNWTVVPRGGCGSVLGATTAFRALKARHNLECRGILDRDYRTETDVVKLRQLGVHVLGVHEIENLLLVEDALRAVAEHLALEVDSVVLKVKEWVLEQLTTDRERIVSAAAAQAIEGALRQFDAKARGAAGLRFAVDTLAKNVDVGALYSEAAQRVDVVLRERDYAGALRVYGNKGLLNQMGRFFELAGHGYLHLVKRLLATAQGESLLRALRESAPDLTTE